MNQQMRMMQVAKESNDQIVSRVEAAVKSELLPTEYMDLTWYPYLHTALSICPPLSQKAPLKDFAAVVSCDTGMTGKISLFEFSVMANAVDAVSVEALGLSPAGYSDFVQWLMEGVAYHNKRIEELKKTIGDQVGKEMQMKLVAEQQASGNSGAKEEGPLKSIKGEA